MLLGSPDSLRISHFFSQNATTGAAFETLLFADNTTWNINMIKAKSVMLAAKLPFYETEFSATVDVFIIEDCSVVNEFTFEEKFPIHHLIENIF